MSKGDSERFVRSLAQRVVRLFYSNEASIVIDQLIQKEPAVRDEELAGRLGLTTKDLFKAIQPLIDGGIVLSQPRHVRNELRDGQSRVTPRVWYYQDLRYFRDSLKWRMHILHEQFEAENKDEIAALGMVCPRCKKEYTLLDVGLLDNGHGGFDCEICGAELMENNAAAEIADSRDQVKRFLAQCKSINDALKEANEMQLSSFNVIKWLSVNFPLTKTGEPVTAASPVAGPSASTSSVQVKIETEADVEARKRKEEEDEIAKREANIQPAWFAKSTIEQERQSTPLLDEGKPVHAIKLEGEEEDDQEDDYETLFGSRSAASTPATSLEHSGILSAESIALGSKRARDSDSDNESTDSLSKRIKMALPSSPVIVEDTLEPGAIKVEEEDDEEGSFEAVDGLPEEEERLFSCGGEMVSYDVIASDLTAYQAKMTPEEWQIFLSS